MHRLLLALALLAPPSLSPAGDPVPPPPDAAPSRPGPPVIVPPAPAPVQPPAPHTSRSAEEKIAQGDRLLASGQERAALFAYQDAVHQDPGSVGARMKLAGLYARMNHLEQAIEQWEIALALDPGNEGALHDLEAARSGRTQPAGPSGATGEPARPHVYKLTPEAEPTPQPGGAPPPRP